MAPFCRKEKHLFARQTSHPSRFGAGAALPGAQIHDSVERLPRPRQMPDCSFLLLVHMGASDTVTENPEQVKGDRKPSGRRVKGSGAQVVFFLILTVTGGDPERSRHNWQTSVCLHSLARIQLPSAHCLV